VVVNVSLFDLQLPVQSVPIDTKVVSSNPGTYIIMFFFLWCLAPLSAISWWSVLLEEETGIPGVQPATSRKRD
jgi:hypothetical protein